MTIRHIILLTTITICSSLWAKQEPAPPAESFSAAEQQQINVETPGLFEHSNAFSVDFAALRTRDYSFPLPVGKAQMNSDYTVDISSSKGDAVKAMFDGKVRLTRKYPDLGNVVVIRHDNGLETVYANNAENLVKVGDRVKAGQTIAIIGTDGGRTYCRFAIMINGNRINPQTLISMKSFRLFKQTLLCKRTTKWHVEVSVEKGKKEKEKEKEDRNEEESAKNEESSGTWAYPLAGAHVISPYGYRGGRAHTGVDIKTCANDPIVAAFDGEVIQSGTYFGYGKVVRIKHANGLVTLYSHNSKNFVNVGDNVKAGQRIALTGRTGSATTEHVHFECFINGKRVNPDVIFDHKKHALQLGAYKYLK